MWNMCSTSKEDVNKWWISMESVPLLLTTGQKWQQCLAVEDMAVVSHSHFFLHVALCQFLFLRMKLLL